MPITSACRRGVLAAAAVGSMASFASPAGAQTCYPPTPGCATTTSPSVSPTSLVRNPDGGGGGGGGRGGGGGGTGGTSTGSTAGGNLARTGVFIVPAALVGAGLVLSGVALKRSSRRAKVKPTS